MSEWEFGAGREAIRLRSLLQAFEAELRDLGRLAENAQTTLSSVLLHVADDPVCHRDAQLLDVLTQRLHGMAGFLGRLTPSIPRLWQVDTSDALQTVSLGHLADRLNGVPVADVREVGGDVEMF